MENIGARRLHSLIEKVMEEISFNAPEMEKKEIIIDEKYVKDRLKHVMEKTNLARYLIWLIFMFAFIVESNLSSN